MSEAAAYEETELDGNHVYSIPNPVVASDNLVIERAQEARRLALSQHYVEVTNIIPVIPVRQEEYSVVETPVLVHNTPCPAYSDISATRPDAEEQILTLELIRQINATRVEIKEKVLIQAQILRRVHESTLAGRREVKELQSTSQKALLAAVLVWIVYLLTEAIFLFIRIATDTCEPDDKE
jgi:hypothetical protein